MPAEHILIVDDERAIQTSLRGVLEDEGYRVTPHVLRYYETTKA